MKLLDKINYDNTWDYLENTIKGLEKELNIAVTIHDCLGVLRDSSGYPFISQRNLHPHAYCKSGRYSVPGWSRLCVKDCQIKTDATAARLVRPFVKSCWKGVYELVVPIEKEDVHIISIFAGIFRKESTDTVTLFKILNPEQQTMYKALPLLNDQRIERCARILQLIGQGFVQYAGQFQQSPEGSLSRKSEIMNFIHYNAHKKIRLSDLAKKLYLSQSRTSHLVTELSGFSFQELVMRERMLRARTLLISTSRSIEEVADAVGISNIQYFYRLFKKFHDKTPGNLRREEQKDAQNHELKLINESSRSQRE